MSEFAVGMKVVCVDDSPPRVNPDAPGPWVVSGEVYVISRTASTLTGLPGVDLEGWRCRDLHDLARFRASRFRPLEYKAMEIFRRIAANPKIKIREDA